MGNSQADWDRIMGRTPAVPAAIPAAQPAQSATPSPVTPQTPEDHKRLDDIMASYLPGGKNAPVPAESGMAAQRRMQMETSKTQNELAAAHTRQMNETTDEARTAAELKLIQPHIDNVANSISTSLYATLNDWSDPVAKVRQLATQIKEVQGGTARTALISALGSATIKAELLKLRAKGQNVQAIDQLLGLMDGSLEPEKVLPNGNTLQPNAQPGQTPHEPYGPNNPAPGSREYQRLHPDNAPYHIG